MTKRTYRGSCHCGNPKLLAEAQVRFADGRNDNWLSPPAETRHL